jgi:hypothetical protein
MVRWPEWWSWEVELSGHLLKRMQDRRFSETDLREMLEDATGYREDFEAGRRIIKTARGERIWEVLVEPVHDETILLVVTAYPVE